MRGERMRQIVRTVDRYRKYSIYENKTQTEERVFRKKQDISMKMQENLHTLRALLKSSKIKFHSCCIFVADRKLSSEDSKALQNQEERGII